MVIGKRQLIDLSWEIAKKDIQLSHCLLILELKMQIFDILKHRQVISAIHYKSGRLHCLDWKLDVLADWDLYFVVLLVIQDFVQTAYQFRASLILQIDWHDFVDLFEGSAHIGAVMVNEFLPQFHLLQVLLRNELFKLS